MTVANPARHDAALRRAKAALLAAATELASMPNGESRFQGLRLIATLLIGEPNELRASVVDLCPDIDNAEPIPDSEMCDAELELVSHLTKADIELIDQTLLSNATATWQGLSRLIGYALVDLAAQLPGIPSALYLQRVAALVRAGALCSEGNLDFTRLGKVKLPGTPGAA